MYRVTPTTCVSKSKWSTTLNHVLRLAGTFGTVQHQRTRGVPRPKTRGFESLSNAILTPREQKEFDIIGPKTEELPVEATIGLILYGVVTATDEAGNAAKRNNFEWFYKVAKENIVKNDLYEIETMKLRPSDVPRE